MKYSRRRVIVIAAAIAGSGSIAYANFNNLDLTPNGPVAFGPVGMGSVDTKPFMLTNTSPGMTGSIVWTFGGTNPDQFHMVSPCSAANGMSCTSAPIDGAMTIPVQIACAPTASGTFSAFVHVQSDVGGDPAGDTVNLTCAATGGGGAALILTPGLHAFGDVEVDTTSPAFAFDLENDTGLDPLGTIDISVGAGFVLGNPCPGLSSCTAATALPQGGHMAIEVKAAPTALTDYVDMLTVTHGTFSDNASVTCAGVPPTGGPELALDTSAIDVRTVFATSATEIVTVTNEGDAQLDLTLSVSGTYAANWLVMPTPCTTSSCSIPPGGAPIQLMFQFSPDLVGDESAFVRFQTNDPDDGEGDFTLALTGTGTGGVLGAAPADVDLGQIRIGNYGAASFGVANAGIDVDLPVTVATSSPFAIPPPDTATVPVGSPAAFTVTCTPTAEQDYDDQVVITATGAYGPPSQSFAVHCEGIVSDVSISPSSSYDFGGVRLMRTAMTDFTVTNQSGAMIAYQVPAVADPYRVIAPTAGGMLMPGGQVTVTIEYAPTDEAEADMDVTGLLPSEPTRVMHVTGHGTIPAYTVTPMVVDLGTACVGASTSTPVTLAVTGTSVLHVEAPQIAGDTAFEIESVAPGALPRDLEPGESVDADVVATSVKGEHRATLVWPTDLTPNDQAVVTLAVTGIDEGLAASPGAIDFGETSAAEPRSRTIQVQVCNVQPLAVSARIDGDAGFTLLGPSQTTVGAVMSMPWQVVFAPARRGEQHAVLHLVPDIGDEITIELAGSNADAEVTNYYSCGCNGETTGAGGAMIVLVLAWHYHQRRRRGLR